MKIKFLGATGEVTGSNYLVECDGKKFFVDCGIHQGRNEDEKNRGELALNPGELEALFLTHAHMDHSGRIPFLVRQGFKGKIWATPATVDLLEVLWYDSAHLMKEEAEWKNRKNSRKGLPLIKPLYDEKDVANALSFLRPIEYEVPTEVSNSVRVCYHDAGHILGSASVTLDLKEAGKKVSVTFSGDLGPQQTVLERNPAVLKKADYTLIESTYGDRLHKNAVETRAEFRDVIICALKDKGKVLIPSFVVDRAQRILYELLLMQIEGLMPELPIFFDSPMGVKATKIYRQHTSILSDEIQEFMAKGHDSFAPKGLRYVSSVEESQKINDVPFGIVIAGSGMCTGGRIIHHLKHGIWNPKNHVIFVGYQGYGTLGRRIVDGETELRIAGEEVKVAAQIHTIGGFSSHGDQNDLLAWAGNFQTHPLFLVTHGEVSASEALRASLEEKKMRAFIPVRGQEIELLTDAVLKVDELAAIKRSVPASAQRDEMAAALDEMTRIIEQLRREAGSVKNKEELMPLLLSGRTLLDTARGKAKVL